MDVNVEARPARREGWLIPAALSIPMLVHGIDRINDGHPLSGWPSAVGGVLMLCCAVGYWLTRPRS